MAGKKKTTDTSAEKHAGGRPCGYTTAIAAEVCYRISNGESLNKICKDDHLPHKGTILRWLFKEGEEFKEFCNQYRLARQAQAESMADEMSDIADDDSLDIGFSDDGKPFVRGEHINRSKLRVDTRKWITERLLPKVYGPKTLHEVTGKDGGPLVVNLISFKDAPDKPTV